MGMIKGVFAFLVVAAVVVGLFEIVPPLITNYSFQDDLKTVALLDGSNFQKTDDDIRIDVLHKAKEHDLPIQEKQIKVERLSTPGMSAVYVSADYSIPVNLPGYSFDLHFSPNSGNKGF
jgi:hypothetical protein